MQIQLIPQDTSQQTLLLDFHGLGREIIRVGGGRSDLDLTSVDPSLREGDLLFTVRRESGTCLIVSEREEVLLNDTPITTEQQLQEGDLLQLGSILYSVALQEEGFIEQAEPDETIEAEQEDREEGEETPLEGLSSQERELIENIATEGTERSAPTQQELQESDDDIFAAGSAPGSEEEQLVEVDLTASHWLFKVLTGPNSGAQMHLEDGKDYLIGSDADKCDIVLTDLSVSKQHMRLKAHESGKVEIEDLNSRNGVLLSGEKIQGVVEQETSAIITAGATTFMVVDRQKEQKTLITPTSFQLEQKQEEAPKQEKEKSSKKGKATSSSPLPQLKFKKPRFSPKVTALALLSGFLLLIGFGVYSLFDEEVVVKTTKRSTMHIQELTAVLEEYPYFDFQFNEVTGQLQLSGHILTQQELTQLLARLRALRFITQIDRTNLIVDELVWQQFNLSLEKSFKGITLSGQIPGEYILTGVLRSQAQAEDLSRYLGVNFPYNQRLVNRVVIEQQLSASINDRLQAIAPNELIGELTNGELVIVGTIASSSQKDLDEFLGQVRTMPGITSVRNLVVEQNRTGEAGFIDLSQEYEVTGFTKEADTSVHIIINGRILKRGDQIDGMTITSIRPNMVILERDQLKYRIQYTP